MTEPNPSEMDTQRLTIVIIAFGSPTIFRRTLESLQACRLNPQRIRLLVVENGLPHGVQELCKEFINSLPIEYMYVESKIKTVALNVALDACSDDEVCLFLDDDVRVVPEWLTAYSKAITESPGGAFFGGPIAVDRESSPIDWLVPFLPNSCRGLSFPKTQRSLVTGKQWFLGFNWGARAADLRKAGGFNLGLGPGTWVQGGDETEMQFQLQQAGLPGLIVHDALVWHWVPDRRSTPDWFIRRVFGGGVVSAFLELELARRGRAPALGPWRIAKRLSRRLKYSSWADLILLRPPVRYGFSYTARWILGYIFGMMIGLVRSPLARIAAPADRSA